MSLTDPSGLTPARPDCPPRASSACRFGGGGCGDDFSGACGGGKDNTTVINGNNIFDAIAGVPGTYLSYDSHGNLSFGFSIDLYQYTMNTIDRIRSGAEQPGSALSQQIGSLGPYPSSGFQTTISDYGVYSIASGIIPEYIQAAANLSELTLEAQPYLNGSILVCANGLCRPGQLPDTLANELESAVERFNAFQDELIESVLGVPAVLPVPPLPGITPP
jgi:hypothetical protein